MALTSFMNNPYERKPQKIGESNEQISAIDVGQESKADATDSLKISATVVQNFWSNFCAVTTEYGSKQERSQVSNPKNKTVLENKVNFSIFLISFNNSLNCQSIATLQQKIPVIMKIPESTI